MTWNTVRRNLFNWKHEEAGNLEAKVKGFCAVPHLLRVLKDFILFAEKLAFDSNEINAIVNDLGLLKRLFKTKMEAKDPAYWEIMKSMRKNC